MYNRPVTLAYPASPAPVIREKPLDLKQVFRFLLWNTPLILTFAALFVAAAMTYIIVTPPTFVTSAQLMFEAQAPTSGNASPVLAEEALVEGQMEIMKSGDVLKAVVRRMNLTTDEEFKADHMPLADMVRSLLSDVRGTSAKGGTTGRSPEERLENYTIAVLRGRLWIRRVGQSTVIEIAAASSNPSKAALIANNVAEQYISQNVRMKSQAALQSSEWLAERVSALREAVFAADREVMQFRSSGDPASQFKLVELRSVAETNRKLYETYLQSWAEAKQRISYPVSDATFVSRAAVPVTKSHPKGTLVVAFALILGLGVGIVVAIARHLSNRFITSTHRMASETGVPCVAVVTKANRSKARRKTSQVELLRSCERHAATGARAPFERDLRDLRATLGGMRRNGKVSLIGLVAAESRAGATTLAFNLARLASGSGSKTLLIDASATNPVLSQAFGEGETIGLMEILNDPRAYVDFISRADKRLTILPIGTFRDVTPGERIGSERIAFNFSDLKDRFDLILIDLPAVSDSSDAKSIAPYLDGTLIVVRHGKSSFDTLAASVNALREVGGEILGVVLNGSPRRKY